MNSSISRFEHSDANPAHLTVRRLMVDLRQGFDRHWTGDAFTTAFYNALSFSFPEGEQFFIEAVNAGALALPADAKYDALRQLAKEFVGQEATHRHLHGRYNAELERQGMVNHWGPRIKRRLRLGRELMAKDSSKPELHELAITAAFEHFTSVFGDQTLAAVGTAADWLHSAQEPLRTLWHWHAAEETEHKAVAFDLYQSLGGNHKWRMRWFRFVALQFFTDCLRQTVHNLWRDGSLFKPRTWLCAGRFLLGRHGFVRHYCKPLWAYTRPDFHPNQLGQPALAQQWLTEHADRWHAVTPAQPAAVNR